VVDAVAALGRWCAIPTRSCPVDVGDHLGVVLGRLAEEPATVTVRSGETIRVDDGTFLRLATSVLAGPVPHGPTVAATAIELAARSPAEAVALLVDAAPGSGTVAVRAVGDPVAEGAQLSVECADEVPGNDFAGPTGDGLPATWEDRVAAAVRDRWMDVRTLCALWDVDPSSKTTRRAVRSDVPVLVLAGLLDPVTPVGWARHLVRETGGLADAVLVTSEGWSHVPSMSDPCAADLVARFLDDGTRPDAGSVACPEMG
jgi:pimeloyl-ACP methyl ester carboxylesterase